MPNSLATVKPSAGTVHVDPAPEHKDAGLPTDHDLAPWPVDQTCVAIAVQVLDGMGWAVVTDRAIVERGEGEFVYEVVPEVPADARPPAE